MTSDAAPAQMPAEWDGGWDPVDERIEISLAEAERAAWSSLGGYKFWMFGYHAAQWVLLNRVSAGKRPNPFRCLVDLARQREQALAQSGGAGEGAAG